MNDKQWEHNCWTGTEKLNITKNSRIVRIGPVPYIYRSEYWGDYSLNYPIYGNWTKSFKDAQKQLKQLSKSINDTPQY